ncbi:MAG: hypothetical protein U5K32_04040 [Bacteroidales bacterium]|nr:hypothetical protein [Bacteroidales bacterium]
MKKGSLSLSLISAIIFFAGIVFKNFHWPGAGILITLGALVGLVFLLFFLTNGSPLLKSGMEKTNGIIVAIAMAVVLVSFTFKVQHWPGAGILFIVSHIILLISSVLMFIDAFAEADKPRQSIKVFIAFIYFLFISTLTYIAVFFDGFQPALQG